MEEKIKVILVEPGKRAEVKEIDSGLESLQKIVGGDIEAFYPFLDRVAIICNEEGKINALPLNRAVYDDDGEMIDIIAGTFIVAGWGEEDFGSLSEELLAKYWQCFQFPEKFMRANNEIVAVKYFDA